MKLGQTLEDVVGTVRFRDEQGQEVVVPIQELAPFHQVAAEHAQYRPVGAFAQTSCALHEQAVTAGPFDQGSWWRGDVPHALCHGFRKRVMIRLVFGPWEVS